MELQVGHGGEWRTTTCAFTMVSWIKSTGFTSNILKFFILPHFFLVNMYLHSRYI